MYEPGKYNMGPLKMSKSLCNIWKQEKYWERESKKWVWKKSQGFMRGLKVVGCQDAIWKPKLKTLGFGCLAGNNREPSEGPPCRSASWALTRLSDQPGNKSHSWVLNSLRPDCMHGAGDDWWEGFPVRLWDCRIAGTGLFQGWHTRVNIILSDTPFPSIVMNVFINILRKWLKLNHYVCREKYFHKRMWKQCWTVDSFTSPPSLCKNTAEM